MRAETVQWLVHPEYESITHYSTDIFKCVDHSGRVHLIDWSGRKLLGDIDADAVTDYAGGYALVLKGDRILGFLAEAGKHAFVKVNGDYYVTKYSFFSEGYLAVAMGDVNGKQGYLDANGNVYIECQYLEAKPFRHGWAAVRKDGKDRTKFCAYISVDKLKENTGLIGLGGGGENIVEASSFNEDGYAIVQGINGKCFVFNSFRSPERANVESFAQSVDPYDGSYRSSSSKAMVPPVNMKPSSPNKDVVAFSENGSYGYKKSDGDMVALCQFGAAQPFYEGLSIVEKGGLYGILRLLEGSFVAHWPEEYVRVYADGERTPLRFSLEVPAPLPQQEISFEFDEGDGNTKPQAQCSLEFRPAFPEGAEQCLLKGWVSCDGLLLWSGDAEVGVEPISVDLKKPFVTSAYADENDNQMVRTEVTNTSQVSVTVDAVLKVAGLSVPFKGQLEPAQSKTLTAKLKVEEDRSVKATVTVKADGHPSGSTSAVVSLKKI